MSTSASLRFKLEQDTSITANFAQIQYYMIAVSAENGTVSGGGTYEEGNMVTIVATPSDGYRFAGWRETEHLFPPTPRIRLPQAKI